MKNMSERKLLIIGGIVFGVLVIASVGFFVAQARLGKIITTTFPSDATVTVDGKKITATGNTYLDPGKHTIAANRNGFKQDKRDFTIKSGETQDFNFYLGIADEEGRNYLAAHPEEASEIEGAASRDFDQKVDDLYTNDPILQELPITGVNFRIDMGISQSTPKHKFALYVQAQDDSAKVDALETLKYMGYDPANYEIIYTDPNAN